MYMTVICHTEQEGKRACIGREKDIAGQWLWIIINCHQLTVGSCFCTVFFDYRYLKRKSTKIQWWSCPQYIAWTIDDPGFGPSSIVSPW